VSDKPIAAVFAGIVLFIAGLAVGVWTLEQWRGERERLSIAARAEGTVSSHLNGRPIVTFPLPNGDRVTFTVRNAGRDEYPVGARVDVLYRIDQPTEAVIDRPRVRRTRTAVLGVVSLAVMALGAYVSWYARNYDARRAARETESRQTES
jgi:hypothetical protein